MAVEFVRALTRVDATALVAGSMIGSGIFIVSADIARQVHSPGMLLLVWLIAGVTTVIGALTYSELAALFPRAGGQYVYLREGISPLFGYLYGWTLFTVIQSGTIAAVAVAFARFTAVFFPALTPDMFLAAPCACPAAPSSWASRRSACWPSCRCWTDRDQRSRRAYRRRHSDHADGHQSRGARGAGGSGGHAGPQCSCAQHQFRARLLGRNKHHPSAPQHWGGHGWRPVLDGRLE